MKCLSLYLAIPLIVGCSSAPTQTEIDWVEIDGACFLMGENEAYPEERPAHYACVDDFAIARTEITNAQFAAFVDATGYFTRAERGWSAEDPNGPGLDLAPSSAVFQPNGGGPQRALDWWRLVEGANWRNPLGDSEPPKPQAPVVHITRDDAQAFAAWAGGRLPTEAEWEYAARGGSDGELLGWSDPEDAERDRMANIWQGLFPITDQGLDGHVGIAPVAQYPANGFGLHDMIGNVWEWTATPYAADHLLETREHAGDTGHDPSQPDIAVGVIKGGSFLCSTNYCLRFRPAARQAQDLAFGTSHIGFRIVRDVED